MTAGVSLRGRLAAVAFPLAAALMAACISERDAPSGPSTGDQCRIPVSVVDSQHVLVAIDNFLFAPESISVASGATVTWVNCEPPGTEPHTTTSAAATPLWDSGEFPSGDRYSRTFSTPGVYPYFCTAHSGMNGVVVVQ